MPPPHLLGRKQLRSRFRGSAPEILAAFFCGVIFTAFVYSFRDATERVVSVPCTAAVNDTFRLSEFWPIDTGPRDVVDKSRPRVLGVVGIQTGFGSRERRKALRETWLPDTPEGIAKLQETTGLVFRFIIGHTSDRRRMQELEEEIELHKDFIRLDIEEQYLKLTYKTLAFFKAAHSLYDAQFYVKADDDIYLRPDRLSALLAKDRSTPRTYLGCMKKGPVISDPKQKWYEPLGSLLGSEYFLHAYGPIYALSAEVVAGLAVARNDSFRMFTNEDVTLGSWMLAMNVHHEDNRDLCSPQCGSSSIAVWDIPKCSGLCNPEHRLREVHKLEECSSF